MEMLFICAVSRIQRRVSPIRDPGHDKTETQGRVEIKAPKWRSVFAEWL